MRKTIYAVIMTVMLSVGVVGQTNIDVTYDLPIPVSKPLAMQAHAILDSGSSLTGEQLRDLLTPVKSGERVALFAPESLRELDGALRVALGVDTPLRHCRAGELSSGGTGAREINPRELTAMLRPSHGKYCRDRGHGVSPSLIFRNGKPKYAHARVQQKPAALMAEGLPGDAVIYTSGVFGPRVEGNIYTDSQQKPPAAILSTEIKVPERENAMLRDVQAQIDKLRASYKLDEYEKELKSLAEIYENGKRTIDAKYKVAEFQKEAAPLAEQGQTIVKFAILNAKLTEEQKVSMDLVKGDDGNWYWRPKAKLAQ